MQRQQYTMVVVRKLKFKRFARRNGHEAEKFVMDFSEQNAHVSVVCGITCGMRSINFVFSPDWFNCQQI